jgi:hypothetical protein
MSYHVISCHIITYHVISCHIMSYHVISCDVISCHIMSYHVISCHIMSYHVSIHLYSCRSCQFMSFMLFVNSLIEQFSKVRGAGGMLTFQICFPRPLASSLLSGRSQKCLTRNKVNKMKAALVLKLPDVYSLRFRFLANPFPQSNKE